MQCSGRQRIQQVASGDKIDAGRNHRSSMNEGRNGCGTRHGIGKPGIKWQLCAFTGGADKEEQRNHRNIGSGKLGRELVLLYKREHILKTYRTCFGNDPEKGYQKGKVPYAIHDKGLVGSGGIGRIFEPVSD